MTRDLFRLALCCAVLLVLPFCLDAGPAWAVVDTTTGSAVDLAPVLNPIIQGAGMLLAGCVSAAAIFAVNWVRSKLNLSKMQEGDALQAKIDAGAQKYVGGIFAKANVPAGKVRVDTHVGLINDAAREFAAAFADTLKEVGSKDNVAKAKEIIVNRLGMMTAAAQGTPVPNPSAAVPVVAPIPIPVAVTAAPKGHGG